jgi:hypothetical protein
MREINFTTGPVVIGVCVRTGDTKRVFDALTAKGNADISTEWMALGQFCTESKQLDFIEEHFDVLPSPSAKAYVALGVTAGLLNIENRSRDTVQTDEREPE